MDIGGEVRISVAGHRRPVGNAIWRELERRSFTGLSELTHSKLDLLDTAAVQQPEYVVDAAAKASTQASLCHLNVSS
jgi:hypothetical protein